MERPESISPNVVIMTRDELQEVVTRSFHRGVERGKFEESCARSNTPAQGSAGHTEATENTGPASPDAAVRLTNSAFLKAIASCEGEQVKFEDWAVSEHLNMAQHPLHYLFTDRITDASRQGWKAALDYVRKQYAASPIS